MAGAEPRNPLYLLLLLTGILFCVTALAYAVVPVLEDKASEVGQPPPPSPFRESLRKEGWKWLLVEVTALIFFGIASMGLDHYRRVKVEAGDKPPPRNIG
jgi:hypothetical protein